MVKVDIIIVTYNIKEKLMRCIQSLQRYTQNFDYRLTIVNNKSTDGTTEYLKKYNGQINIINNEKNLGFPKGANIGLKNTTNKYTVLLDDDAEVTKGWLDGLYGQIENKPKIGIVGCKIIFPNKRIFCADYRVRPLHPVGYDEIDRGQRDYIKECDALAGTCWLMRRELIKKIGYFDERFFPSQYEDLDYCLRIRLAGYKIIYNGKVKIIHHHLFRDGKQFRENRGKFLKKWKELLPKFPLKDSDPADKYVARGVDYLEKNRYKQALADFKKAEALDERFSEHYRMGIALKQIGKYSKAITRFKKALSLKPSNLSTHFHMGITFKRIGDYKRAVQKFKKVLSLNPSHFPAHCNLVLIYKKMKLVKKTKRQSLKIFSFISANKKRFLS